MPGGDGVVRVSWPHEAREHVKTLKGGALFAIAVDDRAATFVSGGPVADGTMCWKMFRFWTEVKSGKTPKEAFAAVFEPKPEVQPDDANSGSAVRPARKARTKRSGNAVRG